MPGYKGGTTLATVTRETVMRALFEMLFRHRVEEIYFGEGMVIHVLPAGDGHQGI